LFVVFLSIKKRVEKNNPPNRTKIASFFGESVLENKKAVSLRSESKKI
jgi:hypothetical protein